MNAQPASLSFQHYSVSDGLPDNTVNCMMQDSAGFVWIGTNGGICRFNGHDFERFVHDKKNPTSVSGNLVTALEFQKDGTLWIGTGDGGLCYLKKGSTKFITVPLLKLGITSRHVNTMLYDEKKSELYIGMNNGGLFLLKNPKTSAKAIHLNTRMASVFDILQTEKGIYFGQIGSGPVLIKKGYIIPSIEEYRFPSAMYTISSYFRDSRKRIWLGSWSDQLIEMKKFNNEFTGHHIYQNESKKVSSNEITTINEDQNGNLWLGSKSDGLFIYNPEKNRFTHFSSNSSNPLSLKGNRVFSIMKDQEGRMWVGTNSGINIFDPLTNQFHVNWLGTNENCIVRSFYKDGEHLIVGTDKGIFVQEKNSSWTNYPLDKYNDNEQVFIIHKGEDGKIYLGTQNSVYLLNKADYSITRLGIVTYPRMDYKHLASSYFSSFVEYPFKGKNVMMGFAFGHGLCVFGPDSMHFTAIGGVERAENLTRKIFTDSKNRMWFAGVAAGISLMDWDGLTQHIPPKGSRYPTYILPSKEVFLFSNERFSNGFDMIETKKGFIVSTIGSGMIEMQESEGKFDFSPLPVPEINVFGLMEDEHKNTWCITSRGIGKLDSTRKHYFNFGSEAGVPPDGLGGYFYKDQDGKLYCGGNGYFVEFDPDEIRPDKGIPRCLLTHLSVLDEPMDNLLGASIPEFSHKQNTVSFSCASLDYTYASSVEFFYWLEGLNTTWKSNGNNPDISFTGLQPGKYTLHVKSKTGFDVWSKDEVIYSFRINPPFYQTWWFYSLIILVFGGVLFAFYRYRISQVMKLQTIRNKISRDLHDDIGSALGSISYFSAAAERSLKEDNSAATGMVLSKIGSTSREMIESMHDIVWAVNPDKDSFMHLADRMKVYAVDSTSTNDIKLQFYFDEKLRGIKLPMNARKNIFLIFKEAIYNSIKYSACSLIEVKMEVFNRNFRMSVADNGKGFDLNERAGKGFGLKNMSSRAEEIKGKLEIIASAGNGTEVILVLDSRE